MWSDKAVFRSAFTPKGWIEPTDGIRPRTCLLQMPPTVTPSNFWADSFELRIKNAREIYPDPFAPTWIEGFTTADNSILHSYLKCDDLHPRTSTTVPFYDRVLSLHQYLCPVDASIAETGLLLLPRRTKALRAAQQSLELAHSFLAENMRIAAPALRIDKITQFTDQLWHETIGISPAKVIDFTSLTRFFTAPTALGIQFCAPALQSRADTVILLEDEYGAASRMVLYRLLCAAKQLHEPVCVGRCPLFWPDKIDHLLFPARRLLVTAGNRYHHLHPADGKLCCAESLMYPLSGAQLDRIRYNRRRADRSLIQSYSALREVWRVHSALAALCPLSLPDDFGSKYALTNITAKNAAEI